MDDLYLGVGREIITPEVGGHLYGYRPNIFSESIADDLTATAFYFKQGEKACLIVNVTICSVNTELSEELLVLLERETGVPKENCMVCSIHTHSGPNLNGGYGWGDVDAEYRDEVFVPKVLAAAKKAMECPVPVTMGVAWGDSYVGINRRELTLENKITFGQNPWGSFCPRMTVISFRDAEEKTVASMIHYGAHCTAAGHNHEVTRDWPGVMIDGLEKETGAPAAFFNGPEGDVGPRLPNGKTIGDLQMAYDLGAVAARDALDIYGKISRYKTPRLQLCANTCRIPLDPRMPKEEAQAMYEKYKDKTVNMTGRMKQTALRILDAYEQGLPERENFSFVQTAVALDNIVMVGFPYELFSEIGMRIDKAFPSAQVLSLVLTNGTNGYYITQDAICRGGYEVNYFLYGRDQAYCDDADWHLITATVENLKEIIGE